MAADESKEAQVVTTFGRRIEIRLPTDERHIARMKGRRLRAVCGDRVLAEPIPAEPEWLVRDILPRRNELNRPDSRGRREVLAANLSLLVVVAADPPIPDWFIVDRYLSAAELMHVRAAVVFNKTDLSPDRDRSSEALADYAEIGYPVLRCSATSGENLAQLADLLGEETSILVGQSGVGKSSLINALIDDGSLRTAEVSEKSGEGRHTTVNSAMLDLPGGGAVIDSPGVRDYAPAIDSLDRVVTGFREIADRGSDCRYSDCRHLREPDCAVKSAVEDGEISPRRYESYKRLLRLTEQLGPRSR